MKYLLVILISLLVAATSQAAQVGIGVSVQEERGSIYLPIDISSSLRLEPAIGFWANKSNYSDGDEETSIYTDLTLGVFGKKTLVDQLQAYYGARFGFTYYKRERTYTSFPTVESEGHGVVLIPTLGIEYFFHEQFSMGGEVALPIEYTSFDGPSGSTYTEEEITIGTEAKLTARFYF